MNYVRLYLQLGASFDKPAIVATLHAALAARWKHLAEVVSDAAEHTDLERLNLLLPPDLV